MLKEVEQFIQTVRGQICYLRFLQIQHIGTIIKMPSGTNSWDVEAYRNKLVNGILLPKLF